MSHYPTHGKLQAKGVTSPAVIQLPPACALDRVFVKNNSSNPILGGLKIGTSQGAADIALSLSVLGLDLATLSEANTLKRIFSLTNPQNIYFDSVIGWNSANIDIYIIYCILL